MSCFLITKDSLFFPSALVTRVRVVYSISSHGFFEDLAHLLHIPRNLRNMTLLKAAVAGFLIGLIIHGLDARKYFNVYNV